MRNYKKNRKTRAKDSYTSYLQHREQLESKGYTLDPVLSEERFKKAYASAYDIGEKNIVRELAKQDIIIRYNKALDIKNELNELHPDKNYKTKDFIGLDINEIKKTLGDNNKFYKKNEDGIVELKEFVSTKQYIYYYLKTLGLDVEVIYGY